MKQPLLLALLLFTTLCTSVRAQGTRGAEEVRLNSVYETYGLTGKDVVVVMIDRGIDYHHPAYLNADGTTRLACVFDMIAAYDGNAYGVGHILNKAIINADLMTDGPPMSNDNHGHGTATTGIIAGNGGGSNGADEFMGVAPEATIISIKLVQDGFPAGSGQAGETGFFDPSYIALALQFARDKIAELGLPSVTLMNIGSIGGPTDGTSEVGRAIADFAADHAFVCGVGDDGGANNVARGSVNQVGNTTVIPIRIDKQTEGNLDVNFWYDARDRFQVRLRTPSGILLSPGIPPNSGSETATGDFTTVWHNGSDVDFYGSTGDRREVFIRISRGTGLYTLEVIPVTVNSGSFTATMNPSYHGLNNRFLDFATNEYSINDYSASPGVISPSDYVLNASWQSPLGMFSLTGQGDPGEIWVGSSKGPTQDGRLGIDFAAPGEVLYGPYSPGSFYSRRQGNLITGGNNLYGIQNAVSAAAPLTTGVIALMLELDPALSPSDILDILQRTAKADNFTGTTPNTTWGHGKLDAKAAVDEVNSLVSTADISGKYGVKIFPNPVSNQLNITVPEGQQLINFIIRDVTGRVFPISYAGSSTEYFLNMNNIPAGIYFIQTNLESGSIVERVIKQ